MKVEGYHGHPNLNSVDPDYAEDGSNPIPGDLVISSLRDVKHPVRHDTNFGNSCLIMGAVVGFKSVCLDPIQAWKMGMEFKSYKKREKVYVDWPPIQPANMKFEQVSPKNRQTVRYSTDTNFVTIQVSQSKYLYVVKKRSSGDCQDVNDFLWRTIETYFKWSSVYGWKYEPERTRRL